MCYTFLKPFVRKMPLDKASSFALHYFKAVGKMPFGRAITRLIYGNRPEGLETEALGLPFYNPVGLGAGLDVTGDMYNDLNDLGFSFVEIGPLDAGKTRHAIENLQKDPQNDILGACINADHPISFSLAYDFCDFFVIDPVSSDFRQIKEIMDSILDIRLTYGDFKPVLYKMPERMDEADEIDRIVDYCIMNSVDGIETRTIGQTRRVAEVGKGNLCIIANSHSRTPEEIDGQLKSGASLVEIRSGLVYEGPSLVRNVLSHLKAHKKN